MLMNKAAGASLLSSQNHIEDGQKLSQSGNEEGQFSQAIAAVMPMQQVSSVSQQYQQKELQTTIRNESFLGQMQEAILMQRLGVDMEKIKQLREKLDEQKDQFEAGEISEKDFNEKTSEIEKMIAEEYQKGQERARAYEQEKESLKENKVAEW